MAGSAVSTISIYHLRIPLRTRVEHAASARDHADPIVVAIELQDGHVGYGETLPRPYVTGEDHVTVEQDIHDLFLPILLQAHPRSFSELLEIAESLPTHDEDGRCVTAARAALELALLDVYSKYFERPIGVDVINWLELTEFGEPGSINQVRCAGILASSDVQRTLSSLRKMRCYNLCDFKLKVGTENDDQMVRAVQGALESSINAGRVSLRLDANGAWSASTAIEKLSQWAHMGMSFVEQPLEKGDEANLQDVKAHTGWVFVHDESLVTMADAQRLVDLGVADCFNVRISKCGGFLPSLKLVNFCRQHGITYMLGCMVGQTGILSAVERRFLQFTPGVDFLESNYGRFLLRDDVTRPRLRFGYGGKLKPLPTPGWGIEVDDSRLSRLCPTQVTRIHL